MNKIWQITVNGHAVEGAEVAADTRKQATQKWLVARYGSVFHGPYNVSAYRIEQHVSATTAQKEDARE